MKKTIAFILVILLLFASGCETVLDVLEKYENITDQSSELTTVQPSNDENNNIGNLYNNMPILPDLDYQDTDLFEDGYQVVEFDHAPDGDTAIFLVGDAYLKTRFLGVDTKEMSTDSGIPEPWATEAKEYTNDMLSNADEIILELDDNCDTFDKYDRLLAWIWVDGQLLNYMLASRGFADVKYLYDDYKYNDDLLDAEYLAQSRELGIWGNDEPYYNPAENYSSNNITQENYITISEARNANIGSKVKIKGVITNKIENNAFMQDQTGGIYIYTNNENFYALATGNEIIIQGEIADYNGLLEIINFNDSDIKVVSENNDAEPTVIPLSQVSEDMEGQYVRVENAEITFVEYNEGEKGYSIFISQNDVSGEIRIDKHLTSYPNPSSLQVGDIINVVGNIAQHYDSYQIIISDDMSIMYP